MKNNVFLCLLLFNTAIFAQELLPLELVVKVFTDKEFVNEIPKYSTSNYGNYSNTTTVNSAYQLSFKILIQTPETAIVNVTLDSMRQGKDIYVHLRKEEIWKMETIKSLPINNFQYEDWQYLQIKKTQLDSIKLLEKSYSISPEFERKLAFAKIWFVLDDQIIDYFKTNENEFEKLLQLYQNSEKLNETKISDYKNLLITRIAATEYGQGSFDFLIAEFVYSSLGYLYIPNPKDVPKMNGETDIIVIKAMGNGWYFYKKN